MLLKKNKYFCRIVRIEEKKLSKPHFNSSFMEEDS